MKKTLITYILFFAGIIALSFVMPRQTGEWKGISIKEYDAIIEKASMFFDAKKAFSVDVEIASYKTHADKIAYEKQKGYSICSGNYYHQFMLGVHSVQNKQYRFVIDSVGKNIMISDPEGSHYKKMLNASFENFHSYITKAEKISSKELDKVRVHFSEKIKIDYIEMEFDKNGLLKKSISYFRVKIAEDATDPKSKKTSPRIETTFTNFNDKIKIDYAKDFSELPFFSFKNGRFTASKNYTDYYIKDTRLKEK